MKNNLKNLQENGNPVLNSTQEKKTLLLLKRFYVEGEADDKQTY